MRYDALMATLWFYRLCYSKCCKKHWEQLIITILESAVQLYQLFVICIPQEDNTRFVIDNGQYVSILVPAKPSAAAAVHNQSSGNAITFITPITAAKFYFRQKIIWPYFAKCLFFHNNDSRSKQQQQQQIRECKQVQTKAS